MSDFQFNPIGQRGTLMQWTAESGRVFTSKEALGDYKPEGIDSARDGLDEAYEHWGEQGVCIAYYPEDHPCATFEVEFADGSTLHVWACDFWFD